MIAAALVLATLPVDIHLLHKLGGECRLRTSTSQSPGGGRGGGGALQGKGVGMYVVGHLKQTVAEQ